MKKTALILAAGIAWCAWALPQATIQTVTQTSARSLGVTYTLTEDAIVTVDFLTNGVSMGGMNQSRLAGDVNRALRPGTHWFGWTATVPVEAADVSVQLTAHALDNPPDYMVVDLIATNTVRYYVSQAALPFGGITNPIYRTDKLLMRKVPARNSTFLMGNDPKDAAWQNGEQRREVSFTNDWYIGVWEVTKRQMLLISGKVVNYSMTNGLDAAATTEMYPAQSDTWNHLRVNYTNQTTASAIDWPTTGHQVGPDSAIGMLRALTGVQFDLPTEAQWEFACRAGTTTGLNHGKEIEKTSSGGISYALNEVSWNGKNSGGKVHETGLKLPNAWGLYDMHGNVFEHCLDWWTQDASAYGGVDPVGPSSGTARVRRGGHFNNDVTWYHSGYRNSLGPTDSAAYYGFRLWCPLPGGVD